MSNKVQITVVMPVYNKERHVARAINSVLAQTFKNFELVIVCDPSTDQSNKVVSSFLDHRIRVFNREQAGPGGYAARNLGAKMAKGEWIAFLDADDYWFPDHLENCLRAICAYEHSSFIAARFEDFPSERNFTTSKNKSEQISCVSFSDFLTYSPFYTSTVILKRTLLFDIGGFPAGQMSRSGDVDTWLRAIYKAGHYIMSNHIGARYYRDSDNMVTRMNYFTEFEVRNQTLLDLISSTQGTELERKLKRRYNDQVVYAWNQNMHMGIEKNFPLFNKLYFSPQPLKVSFYLLLSLLPRSILQFVHRWLYFVVTAKRKLL